jgi:exonuclease VII small subunit
LRRAAVVLLAVAGLGLVPATAGATSSTTGGSTTTTAPPTSTTAPAPTVPGPPTTPAPPPEPPPPPFEMPIDAGIKLMQQLDTAKNDIKVLRPAVPVRRRERDRLQHAWDRLVVRLADAREQVRERERGLEETHDRLQQLAADAYTQGTPARVNAAVASLVNANDLVDASRNLLIADRYGHQQDDLAVRYEREKRELEQQVRRMESERVEMRRRLDAAIDKYNATVEAFNTAKADLREAREGIKRFKELAVNSASPILGPNQLTAEDLAAFVTQNGHHPQLTVPIEELAKIYIEESADEGVRGDVMWAQSILETGWFGYKGSMVDARDNNFAGIGACDSCSHGLVFPDARTGVRTQVQLLKIYVDPDYGPENAKHEIVRPRALRLGFRGKVHSWWDLTGTWATARNYGPRVYDIYLKMVAFSRKQDAVGG